MNITHLSTISLIALLTACSSSDSSSDVTPEETTTPTVETPQTTTSYDSTANEFTLGNGSVVEASETLTLADGESVDILVISEESIVAETNTAAVAINHGSFTGSVVETASSNNDEFADTYDKDVAMNATFSEPLTSSGVVSYETTYLLTNGPAASPVQGELDLAVDFDAGTLSGTDSDTGYGIDGIVDGSEFSGTTTYNEKDAQMTGGFYDEDYLGGVSGYGGEGTNHSSVFVGVAE